MKVGDYVKRIKEPHHTMKVGDIAIIKEILSHKKIVLEGHTGTFMGCNLEVIGLKENVVSKLLKRVDEM